MKTLLLTFLFMSSAFAARIDLQPGENTTVIDSSYRRVLVTCAGQTQNDGEKCRLNKCSSSSGQSSYTVGYTDKQGYWRELTSCQPLEEAAQNLELFRSIGQCSY